MIDPVPHNSLSVPAKVDDLTEFGKRSPSVVDRAAWTACGWHAALNLPGKAAWKRLGRRFHGPYDLSVNGIRLRIYPAENYGDRSIAFHHRLPERAELSLIESYLPKGGLFIDIGANIGIYAIHASRMVGGNGRVLALEPHAQTYRKLAFNLAVNNCNNVDFRNLAAGDCEGLVDFFPDVGKNAGRSSVLRQAVGRPDAAVTVSMRPLKDLVVETGIGRADLLKIDVEGYEDRVLMPFFQDAPRCDWPKAILIEIVHRDLWKTELISALETAGYQQIAHTDTNLLLARDWARGENHQPTGEHGQW